MPAKIKLYITIWGFILTGFCATAQIKQVGTPFIKNYSRQQHHGGQQTWMIENAYNGIMYFANNDGLLGFDGNIWYKFPFQNRSITRSLKVMEDGRVFAAGYNEFGYFFPEASGKLTFHSLTGLLDEKHKNFGDIWKIHDTKDGIVFQSYDQLMVLQGDSIRVYPAPSNFHFSYYINDELYIIDMNEGLLRFVMGRLSPLSGTETLTGKKIWSIIPYFNKLLIATEEDGIFIYDGYELSEWVNPASDFMKKHQLYCGIDLDDGYFALGSVQNGLIICDEQGRIFQHINRSHGLQNNTILCISLDVFGNLWLGTDNGIDYVEINSPLSNLSYPHGISTGYTAVEHNGYFYAGTNQGVFYQKLDADSPLGEHSDDFTLIESTQGQVWNLQTIGNQVICGHNNGTFLINGSEAIKISDVPGAWGYLSPSGHPDKLIGGTYVGFILFEKVNEQWTFVKEISGFSESSRVFVEDSDGSIWMSHGLKGVYHINFDSAYHNVTHYEFYNSHHGFESDYEINVFKLQTGIIFTSTYGTYKFNPEINRFEPCQYYNELLPNSSISYLFESALGDLWYFSEGEIGVLRLQEDGAYLNIDKPFKQLSGRFLNGFEFVYTMNDADVFIGTENGFTHYNSDFSAAYNKPFNVFLNRVVLLDKDSAIINGPLTRSPNNNLKTDFQNNSIYFSFSANDFENPEQTLFSSYLVGADNDWSNWDIRHNREYTNLHEGNYSFHVKAKNIYGRETDEAVFNFSISPPWRRTTVAYILYFIIAGIGLFLIGHIIRSSLSRSKEKEKIRQLRAFREKEESLSREALEADKEIIRLRNEKLRADMVHRDKELVNQTMNIIQKNQFLSTLREELAEIRNSVENLELKPKLSLLSRNIDKEIDNKQQNKVFKTYFEDVHEDFFDRLKAKHPQLSPGKMHLCAFIRMNLSSKEIAALLNITVRGVEISRYRLRKDLGLNRDINLSIYLSTI